MHLGRYLRASRVCRCLWRHAMTFPTTQGIAEVCLQSQLCLITLVASKVMADFWTLSCLQVQTWHVYIHFRITSTARSPRMLICQEPASRIEYLDLLKSLCRLDRVEACTCSVTSWLEPNIVVKLILEGINCLGRAHFVISKAHLFSARWQH